MRVFAHYAGWLVGLTGPGTQTTEAEQQCLVAFARGRRRLVEIGVWHGATTCRLRAVMAADGVLSAVDPFPPGRLGVSLQKRIAHHEVSRIRNGTVRWLEMRGVDAAIGHEPVDFIFHDGDHREEHVYADWTAWSGLVQPGGIVAIHDSRSTPERPIEDAGSVSVTARVILRDPRFAVARLVDSLTVVRRLAT